MLPFKNEREHNYTHCTRGLKRSMLLFTLKHEGYFHGEKGGRAGQRCQERGDRKMGSWDLFLWHLLHFLWEMNAAVCACSVTSSSLFMGNECCCLCMFCDIFFTFYVKWMLLSVHVLWHLLHFLWEMNAAVYACSVTSSSLFMGNECCCLCMFCDIFFTFYGKWMLLSVHVLWHLLHFLWEMNAAVCACSVTSSSLFMGNECCCLCMFCDIFSLFMGNECCCLCMFCDIFSLFMGNECCCLCMFCHIFWLFVKQLLLSVRHCSGCWLGDREAWSDDLRGQNLQQLLGRKQTETVHSYCPDWKPPDHLFGEWFSRFHLVPGEFCLGHIILNIPDLLYPDPFVSQLQC